MFGLQIETIFFIAVIGAAAIYAHQRFDERAAHDGPGILITIGIFATFFGIASGLYKFDVNDVEKSLPSLINGIKMAFWASVCGVGAALTLKVRHALMSRSNETEGVVQGATADDVVAELKVATKCLDKLQLAIVGGEDSSLLTQIKLARTDQNDRLDGLRKDFSEFAKLQSENNSKALIDALQSVIRDFNEKIHEQFGENFKHLNQAVGRINDWQEQYRHQMQEMIEQQKQTASNMKDSAKAFETVVQRAEGFGQVAIELKETIGTASTIEKALEANLQSLAVLVASAKDGIPMIEAKVTQIVTDVANGARASADMLTRQLEEVSRKQSESFNKYATLLSESQESLAKTVKASAESFSEQVMASSRSITDSVQKQNEQVTRGLQAGAEQLHAQITALSQELSRYIQRHNDAVTANITELSRKTEQQVLTLDTELAEALKKSLESLGQQLGSLSSKFVQDYSPLTERLREVVRIAEGVRA